MTERSRLAALLLFSALLVYAGLLLFSINYAPVSLGLDPSWAFAVNRFAHGPELFGRDLILTYGPLAYLINPEHISRNLEISTAFHILIWCAFVYLMVLLWESGRKIGSCLFLIGLICVNRVYYLYYDYFLNVLTILALTLLIERPETISLLAVLAFVIGVCFLVKFTAFIFGMLLLGIYIVFRLRHWTRVSSREAIFLCVAVLSGPIAYLIYNPSFSGLAGYLEGSFAMSSGYSEIMSYAPLPDLARTGLILCSILLACVAVAAWRKWVSLVGAAMVAATVWIAFKHGFVRAESWHVAMFSCFMVLAMSFLLAQLRYTLRRGAALTLVFAAFIVFALQSVGHVWPVWTAYWWTPAPNLGQAAQLLKWKQTMAALDRLSADAFSSSIINTYEAKLGTSSVLFFPWDVSYGAYRKFTTVPLYATQAYSAYTHFLDEQSARHIAHRSPPIDYVLWEWKAVDGRSLFLDVPATWNALYSGFVPESIQGDAILLKRRPAPLQVRFREIGGAGCRADQWIDVPASVTPLAASLSLPPTLAGKLLTTLYQLSPVYYDVQTKSGLNSQIRFPPDVVSSPFPLNYLALTPTALDALWKENRVSDPVVRFRLSGPGIGYLKCNAIRFYNVLGTPIVIG